MRCPNQSCGAESTCIIWKRHLPHCDKRRHRCPSCGTRFRTYEKIDPTSIVLGPEKVKTSLRTLGESREMPSARVPQCDFSSRYAHDRDDRTIVRRRECLECGARFTSDECIRPGSETPPVRLRPQPRVAAQKNLPAEKPTQNLGICQPHWDRLRPACPAIKIVAGTPMCRACWRGE